MRSTEGLINKIKKIIRDLLFLTCYLVFLS